MKTLFFALLTVCSAWVLAQTRTDPAAAPSTPEKDHVIFDSGSIIRAELSASVGSNKARAGDEITAKLAEDAWGQDQKRLPKGSIMVGRVLEAQPRSGGNSQAKLSLSFYKARLKDGSEFPLNLVLSSVLVPDQVVMSSRSNLAPSMSPPSIYPERDAAAHSAERWSREHEKSPDNSGRSHNLGTEFVSTKLPSGSYTVLTSSRGEVKLKRHMLALLEVVAEEAPRPAK